MFYKYTHKLQVHSPLKNLLLTANTYTYCAFFVTSQNDFFAAIDAKQSIIINNSENGFEKLEKFQNQTSGRIAGFIAYDFNSDATGSKTLLNDSLKMPEAVFFEPHIWLKFDGDELIISANEEEDINEFVKGFNQQKEISHSYENIDIQSTTSQEAYLKQAKIIDQHLKNGSVKAVNYCIQFVGEAQSFMPALRFLHLQKLTEAPYSVFAKLNQFHILSASPERYLKNENNTLTSQPIKGTTKRSPHANEDQELKLYLSQSSKERTENTLTAHLVEKELETIAMPDTVRIDKLCEVQSFKTVHHLVSTVSAKLNTTKYNAWGAIKHTFPMASMTGVPKHAAIKLIDQIENFKRGAYSGAFGWMDPNGNFDFNVLIRTLLYNQTNGKIALAVGSAITEASDILIEYKECLLKAEAILKSLKMPIHEFD